MSWLLSYILATVEIFCSVLSQILFLDVEGQTMKFFLAHSIESRAWWYPQIKRLTLIAENIFEIAIVAQW